MTTEIGLTGALLFAVLVAFIELDKLMDFESRLLMGIVTVLGVIGLGVAVVCAFMLIWG